MINTDLYDPNIKPAIKAQYILDNYSHLLSKSERNRLHSWPDWLDDNPWQSGYNTVKAVLNILEKNGEIV